MKLKLNEARAHNNKEVIDEEKRLTDTGFQKKQRYLKWKGKQDIRKKQLAAKGIDVDHSFMDQTASKQLRQKG